MNTVFDEMGRVTSQTNPFTAGGTPGPATTMQYDITNKAVITTLPDGNTIRSDYLGSAVTLTDQVNRKIKRESDGLGRLVKVTEQDSSGSLTQETSYSYSLVDKLTQVNQGNQLRSYKYDALGRLLYEKIPEQSATINDGTGTYWTSKYTYTEYSALASKQEARGVVASYGYDALHRVTQVSYDTTTAPGVAETPAVSFSYGASGRLAQVYGYATSTTPDAYHEDYSYDSLGRVQAVTRWILGQAYDIRKTYTTSYEYNQASQLTKLVYPSGQQVAVNRDTIGRLQSLTYNPGDTSGYVTGVSYTTAGQVSGLTLGNGVAESYGYDANRLQMTSQTATKSGTTLMSLTYSYQASAGQMGAGSTAGNSGQVMSVSGTINGTSESASYTYDLQGRLVTSNQTSNGSSAQRRFAYDRWGNRTGVWDPGAGLRGVQIQAVSLAQSGGVPTNRIASVTNSGTTVNYSYDAAGNVTNDGAHSYVYDAENRLVSMDSGAAQYRYDQQNRRVCKIVGSAWTHYIWEGGQVIGEHDATTSYTTNPTYPVNSARVDYIYAGSRMAWSRQRASSGGAWTWRYYLSDRLSARVVLDTSGNVVGRQAHLPYGEDFAESGNQQKQHFTSYERDSESGTDYAVNRQYNQSVGRFMRVDPVAAKPDDPQSFNRYVYARNNPIDFNDPLGLSCQEILHIEYTRMPSGIIFVDWGRTYIYQVCSFDDYYELVVGENNEGSGSQDNLEDVLRWILLSEATADIKKALQRKSCRDLFAGYIDPAAILDELLNGSGRGSVEFKEITDQIDGQPVISTDAARTTPVYGTIPGPNGPISDPTTTVGAHIAINDAGAFRMGYPVGWLGLGSNVSAEERNRIGRAVTLLHELAHALDFIYNNEHTSQIDTQHEGQPGYNTSPKNSQLIYDNCFK